MEEKDVLQELRAIRRFVRQTWIMVIVLLVVVVVPTAFVGCSLLRIVLMEFLPHSRTARHYTWGLDGLFDRRKRTKSSSCRPAPGGAGAWSVEVLSGANRHLHTPTLARQ